MMEQMSEYFNQNEEIRLLKQTEHFDEYLKLLKKIIPNYTVFITVCDTGAGPYFTEEYASLMMDLGLKINMFKCVRRPYIAIIENGNVIYEKIGELEKPLVLSAQINDHDVFVYSAGFCYQVGLGIGAMIMFDGKDFSTVARGFRFLIFDEDNDKIVDSCAFDTYHFCQKHKWSNPFESALIEYEKIYRGGVYLCTLSLPSLPNMHNRNLTDYEKFLVNLEGQDMQNNIRTFLRELYHEPNLLLEIYNQKRFPFTYDYNSFDELYDAIGLVPYYETINGNYEYIDYDGISVRTQNGHRVTTDTPSNPKRSIFFVGPSTVFSWGVKDEFTFESVLQRKLNANFPEKSFMVHNIGFNGLSHVRDISNLRRLPVKYGDIVFVCSKPVWNISHCDLTYKSSRPHEYGDIFTDGHFSNNGNRMIADGIYDFLTEHDFFDASLIEDWNPPTKNNLAESLELSRYKQKLRKIYNETISPKIGAIVMNCNPFTLGHRYLVEEALKRCEHLIVFVVEEDKSEFSFDDRMKLVKENLEYLKNVTILPSGEFIISARTFEEYFSKGSLQERKIDTSTDVTLFASEIAPCLNISIRFAGEEPFDRVTKQYNENMSKILPQYGIEFKEIPRKRTDNGEIISASLVRKLAKEGEFEKLKEFAPPATVEYFRKR